MISIIPSKELNWSIKFKSTQKLSLLEISISLFLLIKIKDNLFATVKFVAEVISVKRDKENKIIEGNPDKIKFVKDSWIFTRNINNKNPNWYLSEIISK